MRGGLEPEMISPADVEFDNPTAELIVSRETCVEQLVAAVSDIADFDDIHQAAARLSLVQDWIARETARAAADPALAPLRLAS